MSGDVQPRKRKDKRKKKDEGLDYLNSNPEDIIHVQKDAFLGGNICTKVIFFCLLGALGVMVSFIIFEYRGSNDLETQSAVDSPWSQMLEGWVDSNVDEHHDDHPDVPDDDNDEDDNDDQHGHDVGSKKGHDDDDDDDDGDDGDEGKVKASIKEDKKSKKKSKSKKKDKDSKDDEILEKLEETPEVEQEEGGEEETSGGAGESKVEKEIVASNQSIEAVPKPETPELLSRRKTLVPPSFTEDFHPSRSPSPPLDEYSEDEHEEEEEEEGEEGAVESEQVKQTLDDLKAAYADITPEPSDIEEDYERDTATKAYDYNSTPPESEPELSEPEEEEEEEDEEEEDDEPRSEWQSSQAAHLLAEEVEDLQTESETEEEESDDEPPPPPPVARRRGQEIDENEQIFQDLVYETFEKVEQPLEQYSAKAEEPQTSVHEDNEISDGQSGLDENDGQDPWEPLTSDETFNDAATANENMNEEVEQPAETEAEADQEAVKDYFNGDITNDYDWEIHDDLDAADAELNQGDFNFI